MSEVDWHVAHPWYGPCDGFGQNNSCSECTGLIERRDGSIIKTNSLEVVKRAPLRKRIKRAWQMLTMGGIPYDDMA